jgi:hypothetical protein
MSDEARRELERAAGHDPIALTRLTAERLRCKEGIVLVWVERPLATFVMLSSGGVASERWPTTIPWPATPAPLARGPEGSIEVILEGYATGGDTVLFGQQPPPAPKRAWILACLDMASFVFEFTLGSGPAPVGFLDLGSGRLASFGAISRNVAVGPTRPVDESPPHRPRPYEPAAPA